jgi:hypothetical protein
MVRVRNELRRNRRWYISGALAISALAGFAAATLPAAGITVTIPVNKDNTLFEDPIGTTAGGAGDGIYSGKTGTSGSGIRRALVQFDLSSIPRGSTVNSAVLTLTLVKVNNGTQTHTIHKVLADWGEGPSVTFGGSGVTAEPGDVTWLYRFYPGQPWTNPGGDFVSLASASRTISSTLGPYSWGSTNQMVLDVQSWLNNPASNFGWVVRGNESTLKSAKKFSSKEAGQSGRATLTITYTPPPPCPADKFPPPGGDHVVNIDDLLFVINAWGQTGAAGTVPADINNDGVVNIDDMLLVINQWGYCG